MSCHWRLDNGADVVWPECLHPALAREWDGDTLVLYCRACRQVVKEVVRESR
jgi:hypothetical protein